MCMTHHFVSTEDDPHDEWTDLSFLHEESADSYVSASERDPWRSGQPNAKRKKLAMEKRK